MMNPISKTILAIITSFSLQNVVAEHKTSPYQAIVNIEGKKIEYKDQLMVNRDSTVRTVIKKNEIEGLRDLDLLVKTEAYEEGWVYLPEKEEWHEVGMEEFVMNRGNGSYISGFSIDLKYENRLAKENNLMYRYHFHPADTLMSRYINELKIDTTKNSVTETLKKYKKSSQQVDESFGNKEHLTPSVVDLNSMISGEKRYSKINGFLFIEKLKSEYGLSEFNLTEKGLKHYISTDSTNMDFTKSQIFTKPDSTKIFSTDLIKIKFVPNSALYKEKQESMKATSKSF